MIHKLNSIVAAISLYLVFVTPIVFGQISENSSTLFGQEGLAAPHWIRDRVIYEVNVRQYSEASTFAAVESDLDRIAELGVGALWFMPVHPVGKTNRKGSLGSPYSVSDYRTVNPEFGSKEDFKRLVQTAHSKDLKVIIDWVANHTAWDNPLAVDHPDYYARDDDGNFQPPLGTDWSDVIQLDFENPALHSEMIAAMAYWITEFDIDGFRCDYAVGVPTEFWNEASASLRQLKPDLFLLAEADNGELNLSAFHASYGWKMHHTFNDIAQGKATASSLDSMLAWQNVRFPERTLMLNFTSNHDENSWAGTTEERMGNAANAFAVLSFCMEGIPLIYNGQEAGLGKRLEFFERDPIKWDYTAKTDFYKTLCNLKKHNPALRANGPGNATKRISTTDNESIYAFARQHGAEQVLVFANLTRERKSFAAAGKLLKGRYIGVFTNKEYGLDETASFELPPWGYMILNRLAQ